MSEDDLDKAILEIQGARCDNCDEDTNHCKCKPTCLHHQEYMPGLGDPTGETPLQARATNKGRMNCAGCWQARSKYIEGVLARARLTWLEAARDVRVPPLVTPADAIGNRRRCFNAGVVAMEDAIQELINLVEG